MSKKELPAEDAGIDAAELGINTAIESIAGVPIPKPVRQNALKAFGRLCSAAIEIPIASWEGIAAEKKALAEARVKLIETTATQIANQMEEDKEYARVAFQKYGQKIIREQVNLDQISEEAARQLKDTDNAQIGEEIGQIDDDWLNHFEKEACQRSTEDMQLLFGKILAGEIRRPSSFSIKAVKIMGEIDKATANLFKRLCSMCIVMGIPGTNQIFDARVVSLSGNAGNNALQKYGLGFDELNILHEYGLIIADYNSWRDYRSSIAYKNNVVILGFSHQNTYWGLLPEEERKDGQALKLHGVALSQVGRELLNIVEVEPIENYTNDLIEFFAKRKLKMVPISEEKGT
ncbi:MAG: DUF2806 domain-containing protein [Gemmatimonadetes bacterium]|nr:DUF2806 domain-containing protein [Gemmatimonadota bacterium]